MSPKKEKKKPTAVIAIRLEIEGDADGALEIVDGVLDYGSLQDRINDHDNDDVGPLHVISAVASLESIDLGEK